jgi:hypothetical protein
MDDYIYIILGLLWLVFTFYTQSKKQKKKKEQAQSKPSPEVTTKKPTSLFEQLFREEMPEEEPTPVFEEPTVLPEEKQTSTYKSFREEYSSLGIQSLEGSRGKYYEEGQKSIYKKEDDKTIAEALNSLKDPKRETIHFDLRKAVILAEILKRPYA